MCVRLSPLLPVRSIGHYIQFHIRYILFLPSSPSCFHPHLSVLLLVYTVAQYNPLSAFKGSVDVWSIETGSEPIHHLQHLQRVNALVLSPDHPSVATACGADIRVDSPDDKGYWRTLCLTHLPKPVSSEQCFLR